MNIDIQTLSWINRSEKWMIMTTPEYIETMNKYKNNIKHSMGGGLAENACLPDSSTPTYIEYFDNISSTWEVTVKDDYLWGFEKWQHSQFLINNPCGKCPRCKGEGVKWWQQPFEIEQNR